MQRGFHGRIETELAEIFADSIADDKRAAGVIAQLRELMVKGEATLEPMNLNEAVSATITLASSELLARQTNASFRRRSGDLLVDCAVAVGGGARGLLDSGAARDEG